MNTLDFVCLSSKLGESIYKIAAWTLIFIFSPIIIPCMMYAEYEYIKQQKEEA